MRTVTLLCLTALASAPCLASAQSTDLGARPMPLAPTAVAPAPTPFTLPSSAPPQAPAVELARHRMHVTMDGGFAVVAEELTLHVSGSQRWAHLTHLVVPATSELVALQACQAGACRDGTAVAEADRVFASAQYGYRSPGNAPLALASRDGERLEVHVAGLEVGTATIRVVWSAATERFAGRERLRMPARTDSPELTLASGSLDALCIEGDASIDEVPSGRAFDLVGAVRAGAPTLEVGRIDERGTGFVRVTAPVAPARARHVVVLVDASPSARRNLEAMDAALSMLLDETPEGSTVTVIAFARRARIIAAGDIAAVRQNGVRVPHDLGPSTSLRAALALLDDVPADASLVWLGDGATGVSGGELDARAELVRRGAREHVIQSPGSTQVGDLDPLGDAWSTRARLASSFAEAVDVSLGDRVVRVLPGRSVLVPLRSIERVPAAANGSSVPAIAAAPVVRASLGWGRARALLTLDPRDRRAADKTGRGRFAIFVGGGGLEAPTRRVPRICGCGWGTGLYGSISREAIHRMMATLRAPVSACFADARDGDPHYEGRATFVLALRSDELAAAHVETNDPSLRACLLAALDHLDVPSVASRDESITVVRYPFVASAVDPHVDAMPLGSDTASSIDATFASEPSVPPMSLLTNIAETDSTTSP